MFIFELNLVEELKWIITLFPLSRMEMPTFFSYSYIESLNNIPMHFTEIFKWLWIDCNSMHSENSMECEIQGWKTIIEEKNI